MSLLTGKQLVGELERLGLGTWSAEAVRQWIREEPACPVAQAADQGKPHRYQLLDVLGWLLERAKREKAKGFTSAGSTQLVDRIELVLRQFVTAPSVLPAVVVAVAPACAVSPAAVAAPPMQPDLLSPAKGADFAGVEIESCTDVELLLQVIQGRNPNAWRAAESALNERRKRLEAEGRLVPVQDLDHTLGTLALAVSNALEGAVLPLAQRIPDHSTLEVRRAIIQAAFDALRDRLSLGDDDAAAEAA